MPTLDESGYPGVFLGSWNGIFAPAGTPDDVAEKLNAEISQIMQEPEVQEQLKALGFNVMIKSLAESSDYFKSEVETWGTMVKAIGYKSE